MDTARDALPDDITALKEALIIERAKAVEVAAELAVARAKASEDVALIAQQKLRIAKLERQVYGQRSERSARLIDQLALEFEELEAGAMEDELAAETAVAKTMSVRGFTRKRPERNTFPDHNAGLSHPFRPIPALGKRHTVHLTVRNDRHHRRVHGKRTTRLAFRLRRRQWVAVRASAFSRRRPPALHLGHDDPGLR